MRSAQIDENNVVVNFAEVSGFDETFIDPMDAVMGSVFDSESGTFTAPTPDPVKFNEPILQQLAANDAKAIRSLLEGDQPRIAAWKAEQAALRGQLMKT